MEKAINYRHLKILALIAMTVDHIGAILMTGEESLRIIGRVSFPIFLFMIINSAKHTSDYMAFMKRLLIFSAASMIPYYLAFHSFYNVGFIYAITIAFTAGIDSLLIQYRMEERICTGTLAMTVILPFFMLADKEMFRFCWYAIGMGLIIYYRGSLGIAVCIILSTALAYTFGMFDLSNNVSVIISLPVYWFLFAYDKQMVYKKQTPFQKYFYYIYYPAHLLFLVAIKGVIV